MRTRAERRHNDWTKAKRKWRMDLDTALETSQSPNITILGASPWYLRDSKYWLWYDNLHQYSKNKIHCSCGMCSAYHKTNNKGRHRLKSGNYAPSYNPSARDRRNDDHMAALEQDYLEIYLQGDCD